MTALEAGLEAVLFAAGDAVTIERLSAALEVAPAELLDAAAALENRYDFENRGIMLLRIEDKLQLASRPMYGPYVRRVTESRRPPALSPAALEVLTIIAYRQPVTRAFIDQLRGVDSSNTVSSLAEKGLIEEAGRLDVEGRCEKTAEKFGLSPRETEILGYLGRGHGIVFIANTLVISESTVRTHVKNIYRKLGVNSREELLQLVDRA